MDIGIPGPVLLFQISAPNLAPVQEAMAQAKQIVSQTTQNMASEWQRLSAQMRASISAEALSTKEILAGRTQIVAVIDREISALRVKDTLSTKELSTLKQMTLERERQTDALKRQTSIGITAGTKQALGYGAGLIGGGGSIASAAGALTMGGGPALAIAAIGAAAIKAGIDGGKLAVELENLGRRTGLTTENIVKLRSASEALDLNFDNVLMGFRKFDTELTLAMSAGLPNATMQAKKAGKLLSDLGVDIKEAAKNPYVAITQISAALRTIPDDGVKVAVIKELFGRGLDFVTVLDKLAPAIDATSEADKVLIDSLRGAAGKSFDLKVGLVNFQTEIEAIEVSLSQNVVPALSKFLGVINAIASAANPVGKVENAVNSQLARGGQQLSAKGKKDFDLWLQGQSFTKDAAGGFPSYLANPQQAIDDFKKYQATTGPAVPATGSWLTKMTSHGKPAGSDADFESFTGGVDAAAAASPKLKNIPSDLGTLGTSAGNAAKKLEEARARIDKSFSTGLFDMSTKSPSRKDSSFEKQQSHDDVMENLLDQYVPGYMATKKKGGSAGQSMSLYDINAAALTVPAMPSVFGSLGAPVPFGGIPAAPKPTIDPDALLKQINDEHDEGNATELQKAKDHYAEMLAALKEAQTQQLISAQEFGAAKLKIDQDLQGKEEELNKKYEEQAGNLFDDLLGGKGKDFAKSLQKDLEEAFLKPVKDQFDKQMGKLLGGISKGLGGDDDKSSASGASSWKYPAWLSKIAGKLGIGTDATAPGGTSGTVAGAIGSGAGGGVGSSGSSSSSTGIPPVTSGQGGISTATMTVSAQVVNIGGPGSNVGGTSPTIAGGTGGSLLGAGSVSDYLSNLATGASGASGAVDMNGVPLIPPDTMPNIFGNLGDTSNFFGNNNAFGGSTSASGGNTSSTGGFSGLGGAISSIAPGVLLGGLAAMHGSVAGEATGAASAAGGIANILGKSGVISTDSNSSGVSAGSLMGAFAGAGELAGGIAQGGGVKGTLQDAMGGAQLGGSVGMMIGGPVGAGIGAAVGAIGGALIGGIQSIFSGDQWANKVKKAMKDQYVALPPSEQFSFASNGSIASTLNTGAAQSGATFSQYALPSNTPFTASPVFGPLGASQKAKLQQMLLGMNPNEPFGGFPTANPFTGQDPSGYGTYPNTPPNQVHVHLVLPNLISSETAQQALGPIAGTLAQLVARQVTNGSSGFSNATRRAINLP